MCDRPPTEESEISANTVETPKSACLKYGYSDVYYMFLLRCQRMTAVILRAARMKKNICLLITNITLMGPTEPTAPTVTCPRPTVPTNTNRPGRSSRETVPASPLCVKTCTNITGPVLEILNNVNAVFHHPLQCFAFHVLVFFIGKRSPIIKAPFRFNATHFSLLAGE